MPICPSSVNLKAFDTRFRTIFLPHVPVDVDQLAERRALDDQRRPARSVADRNALARLAVSSARSVGS